MKPAIAALAQTDPGMVLAKAATRAAAALGLNGAALARVIGTSESTVSRLQHGERALPPLSKQGELALLLVRLYRSLDALVGNDSQARLAWMGAYNRALNGVPRELIQRSEGLVHAVAYADSMRATL
ncbi:MAG TPA: antitoxin Xre-like helix-turn-helix domain-containing protein [Burkholderiaceae bacterium]|jgi:transcriptional regulator with XRE-family HTH domain|nr:antitoxin Xre-like helix-turn-helix domain-containing protein [Burkholderiaceae bacterium]